MTLITEDYRAQNRALHESNAVYGVSGAAWAPMVRELSGWGRQAILDYGAGKCTLARRLGPAYRVTCFDPCIDGLDTPPQPHPVVVCGDVLEHVEPDCLDAVVADLHRLAQQVALIVVHLAAAQKTLPDGTNAHRIVAPAAWWHARLNSAGLIVERHGGNAHEAWFVCRPARAS